jgi:hypothetical protein
MIHIVRHSSDQRLEASPKVPAAAIALNAEAAMAAARRMGPELVERHVTGAIARASREHQWPFARFAAGFEDHTLLRTPDLGITGRPVGPASDQGGVAPAGAAMVRSVGLRIPHS